MELSEKQYLELAAEAAGWCNAGTVTVDVTLETGETFYVRCKTEADGYTEDDYLNGTGAWVTTDAWCEVEDWCVDSPFEEAGEMDFDEVKFCQLVREELV